MTKYYLLLIFSLMSMASISAQCEIRDLEINRTACNADNLFNITINFVHNGTGDMGFRVQGNGVNYGVFEYTSLPITIENLSGDCVTEYEFVIRDVVNPSCSANKDFGIVCCDACSISIKNLELGQCANGGYNVTFDLDHEHTLNQGVDVYANGNFVKYASYSDFPVTLEDIPSLNDVDNYVVVCDNDNSSCCDTIYFDSPCVCNIYNIRSRIVECNPIDSTFFIRYDFETNMVSDSFVIGGEGTFFGAKSYTNLPEAIGPIQFSEDTTYYLIVDKKNSFCFEEMVIPPVTECNTTCTFSDINLSVSECNENQQFYVTISFAANNPGLNGFTIRGNGKIYGEAYQYGQESYTVGPLDANCETIYEFILIDNDINDCQDEAVLDEVVCCEACSIRDLTADAVCDGDVVSNIMIDFIYDNSIDSMFIVVINTSTYGPFHQNQLPLNIEVSIPGSTQIRVEVKDQNNPDCKKVKEFNSNCGEVPCVQFTDIITEFEECLEDNTYYLDIEFNIEGTPSNTFFVKVKEQSFGPFMYGDDFYRIGPLVSDCKRTIFTIIDGERPDCNKIYEIDEIKCCVDCEIQGVELEVVCNDGVMTGVSMNVGVTGDDKTQYNVKIGNETFGPFNYNEVSDFSLSLANGTYTIVIFDREFEDCRTEKSLEVQCDNSNDCGFNDLSVEAINCTEETFQFILKLKHNRSANDLFNLYINQELKGTSSYSFLPFTTGLLQRNEGGPWHILIRDLENDDCAIDVNIAEELCESSTSDIEKNLIISSNYSGIQLRSNQGMGDYNVSLYDILGRKQYSTSWNSTEILAIDIVEESSKIYILVLEQNGILYSTKILKM